jgi:hypothetical protein
MRLPVCVLVLALASLLMAGCGGDDTSAVDGAVDADSGDAMADAPLEDADSGDDDASTDADTGVAEDSSTSGDSAVDTGVPCTVGEWSLPELVDSAGNTGLSPSIAVGPDGRVHVLYLNATADEIRHAVRDASGWALDASPVATGATGEPRTSIVAATDGTMHASFGVGLRLRHGELSPAGSWTVVTPHPDGNAATASAVALLGGQPAIIYWHGTSVMTGDLRFVLRDSAGSWAMTTADAMDDIATRTMALERDAAGDLHALYLVQSGEARHATRDATGAWSVETIGMDGFGLDIDGAFDSMGRLHACIVQQTRFRTHYALRALDGSWTVTEVIDATSDRCALAVDGDDVVHIFSRRLSELVHLESDGSGSFTTTMIRPVTQSGVALTRDDSNTLHALYRSSGSLQYLTRPGCS